MLPYGKKPCGGATNIHGSFLIIDSKWSSSITILYEKYLNI
jgi:hypothetical protein